MENTFKMVDSNENLMLSCTEFLDRHLYLFYSMFSQPKNLFQEYKLLTKLIVLGQDPGPLEGIQNLEYLEEVWIVDASLEQESIGPLCECFGLKRLYLYGNRLTEIPNLIRLKRLAHLWLSDNNITSLQNINSLVEVKELYLSNNKISGINVNMRSNLKIVCLNLSGNPISNMKEVPKLISLRKLQWLIFSDPLYKPSPITLLAHLRTFVIYSLPELESLDMVIISKSERSAAVELYESKLQYYKMLYHNSLSRNLSAQKSTFESKRREFELIWSALHNHGPQNNETAGEKSCNLKFWEAESKRWKERKHQCLVHYKKLSEVTKERIQLELEHSGNIRFMEVNLKDETTKNHYKTKLESFICPFLKGKASEVHLLNVWSVQGPYRTTILQSQFRDLWEDVFILQHVQDLGVTLFQFVEELFFKSNVGRQLSIANCLSCVDPVVSDSCAVHRQLLLRSLAVLDSRVLLLCGVRGGAHLIQSEQAKLDSPHSPKCGLLSLSSLTEVIPLYLVHYQYIFQDYFKPLKESTSVGVSEPVDSALSEISRHCSLAATKNITELVISNNNIHMLDIPAMEHVTVVDLSYNQLTEMSSIGTTFTNLISLDLSFNRLNSLDSLQVMKGLTRLVVKWNFLTEFQSCVRRLKEFSSLKHLDLSWNPFCDVVCREKKHYLVRHQLNSLLSFNGCSVVRCIVTEQDPLLERQQFPTVAAWRGSPYCLTLQWRAEMSAGDEGNHLGAVADHIVSVTIRNVQLTQFSVSFPIKKLKWIDLSHNLINSSSVLKGLFTLEEVNLSYNVMESFSDLSEKFRRLTKMNLSHNFISSLVNFRPQSFPNLKFLDLSNNCIQSLTGMCAAKSLVELYLSHNLLTDCETLVNCKTWSELSVLDLSHNPLACSNTFRQNCLYYISSLKYINGSRVQEGELKNVMALYGGLLDNNYLVKVYSKPTLANLTHLNLSKCSLKQVSLSDGSFINVTSMILDHNKISSLSWLRVFPNLTMLSMSHNRVRSYYEQASSSSVHRLQPAQPCGLQPSNCLISLVLDHNGIHNLQLLRLDLFPRLTLLVLNDNQISSMSGLKENCELEQLVLDRNNLSCISIDHTSKLVNLVELYLERNSLTKLQFLCPLKKLRKLFVGFNKLLEKSCLEPLGALPELTELTIHGNPLFRCTRSYRDCLPNLPSLQLLEGHPVNNNHS